jgi:hypothetical protein
MGLDFFCPSSPNTVALIPDASYRDEPRVNRKMLEDGIAMWQSGCSRSRHPSIPNFTLNWTGTRPATPDIETCDYKAKIGIRLSGDEPKKNSKGAYEAAYWDPLTNSIVLHQRCPRQVTGGLPCQGGLPNGYIKWNEHPAWAAGVIGHEIGHALGLDDEAVSTNCVNSSGSIMWYEFPFTQTNFAVYSAHCAVLDRVNDESHVCNDKSLNINEPHPCDAPDTTDPLSSPEGGPGNQDQGYRPTFCGEYPWLCSFVRPPGPFVCEYGCVSYHDSLGAYSSERCDWGCSTTSIGTASMWVPLTHAGPRVSVALNQDQEVSGLLPLGGWAVHYGSVEGIAFDVDGQRVQLRNFRRHLSSPGACVPPLGLQRRECNPNSGFAGELDTTQLSNGEHKLAVIAWTPQGYMTTVERRIRVNNLSCGDTAAPTVAITLPTHGRTVGGAVRVEAAASDGVGVQEVRLLVDGQEKGRVATPPYRFVWQAGGAAAGEHRLKATASDACGNVGTSADVLVVVDNARHPYLGLPALVPGRVEAEHYDAGSLGMTHDDTTSGNLGGHLRTDDVDVTQSGGVVAVTAIATGEWLEHSVEVTAAGVYDLAVRSASPQGGGRLRFLLDGVELGTLVLPATGGWNTWAQAALRQVSLPAGIHQLRTQVVEGGFNVDWLEFKAPDAAAPPAIVSHPLPQVVGAGDPATFSVGATGQGTLSYRWQRNGVPLNDGGVYSGARTATLRMNGVQAAQLGEYRCEVSNAGGSTTSNPAVLSLAAGTCQGNANTLCLFANRFRVSATIDGQPAPILPYSDQAGFFRLWNPQVPEVAIKLIDARPSYGHFWLFHGSMTSHPYQITVHDTVTGSTETLHKTTSDLCGGTDFDAFLVGEGEARGACAASSSAVCLGQDRFQVEVRHNGVPQAATRLTGWSGVFAFGAVAQPEVVVNVLDASAIDGHFWIFFGSLTSQPYEVVVTDTASMSTHLYPNPGPLCGRAIFGDF